MPVALKCPVCGALITSGSKFCPECGAQIQSEDTRTTSDNKKASSPTRSERLRDPNQQATSPEPARSHGHKGLISIILLIALIGLWVTKPWIPRGYKSPDNVMSWVYKNAHHQIDMITLTASLDNTLKAAGAASSADQDDVKIHLMKNTKSKDYVFKLKRRYIYLIRITEGEDFYYEEGVALKRDNDGKVYHHQLSRSEMDQVDSNAREEYWWTNEGFDDLGNG
ncbi:MAG: zinc ribbon domain-containing protein [Lentilactobacillus buchneri]|jgi:uncharacterized Zn finger protein (UPF0148 family)|nr:zinc ribbon domain-containing protein [Lentilactobacillus buchneri]MCI1950723.1 zinc ribbon domain-containing protein [Lentilactobacillus buchneri]MCI2018201.1 zinc ribbon domain-containing protein [Lentilactobacillus buchneri]MCI2027849.1 zinc ribbon domain-containing protein [Lentilactobacillus buchneri]